MRSKLTGRWRAALGAGAIAALAAVAGCGSSTPAATGAPASSSPASSSPAATSPAGSGSSGSAASQQVTLTGTSGLRFMPMTVHVQAGPVRVTLKDMGAYPHNVVIPALGLTSKTVTGDPGSSSVSFTVTFKHPGHYAFHCQYHQSAGMVGVFVVS
jgi:plastocyanin